MDTSMTVSRNAVPHLGMGGAELAHVFHAQRQAGLVGVDGHVLGPVVGENALDIREESDGPYVSNQDEQAQGAFD